MRSRQKEMSVVTRLLNGELRCEPSLPSPPAPAHEPHAHRLCSGTVGAGPARLLLSWEETGWVALESVLVSKGKNKNQCSLRVLKVNPIHCILNIALVLNSSFLYLEKNGKFRYLFLLTPLNIIKHFKYF